MNDLMRRLLFLPEQGSQYATNIDYLHYFVIGVTFAASTVLGVLAVYFMVHYRRRRANQATPHIEAPAWMEMIIIGAPLALFLLWFRIGFAQFSELDKPPADAMDVYVMAKKWMWKFSYDKGPNGLSVMRVPAGRPVRLLITSRDVVHSFYVPGFRIKRDAIPGRYTELWFNATRPGRYPVFCAEFCGTGHSSMRAEIDVLDGEDFDRWLASEQRGRVAQRDTAPLPGQAAEAGSDLVAVGQLLAAKNGCLKCHSIDGTRHIGPSWLNMYGSEQKLADGSTVKVDEAYITESMMAPKAKQAAGYPLVMPSFFGKLAGPESAAILEYIKSLRQGLEERPVEGPVYKPEADAVKAAEGTP
jgi:cytochrome c oxidase subunit 2